MSNHVGKGDNLPSTSLAGDVDGDKYFILGKGWASYNPNYTESKYGLKVAQIEIGDIGYFLYQNKIIESKLVSIRELNILKVQTFNIQVKNNKNYLANGMLVHNKGT
jgi:hypothetical protein